jgi:hypothetical protein
MTGPAAFLEFFILEASDYVEQLDGLLLRGGSEGPDAEQIQRVARALRGTATMAKIPSFSDLAAAVERVGRGMHDGSVRWDPALGGLLVAAIDDLKTLLHAARGWSAADDLRAARRAAELSRYAPPRGPMVPEGAATRAGGESAPFLATEAGNIAAGLELLGTRSGDASMAANVLRRVRALRGVAGVKEIVPLAETLEATEEAARGLESGQPVSAEGRQLLAAAADYLRTLSAALRDGGDVGSPGATRDAFAAAHERWDERVGERERVVPISNLFYEDGGAGVIETSLNPPTSAAERFRLELVSLGEHLRQILDSARGASDPAAVARARRDLRRALGAMQSSAMSFGERDVASFIGMHLPFADHIDFLGLTALDDLATAVSDQDARSGRLAQRMRDVASSYELTKAIGVGLGSEAPKPRPSGARNLIDAMSEAAHLSSGAAGAASGHDAGGRRPLIVDTPVYSAAMPFAPLSAPAAPAMPGTSEALDAGSASLIDSGIAALEAFNANPFADLVTVPDEVIVPIEQLLYRGRAALDRAVEIRDELRRTAPGADPSALEELYDLVELARAD